MNNDQLNKLKIKLTATKTGFAMVNGKLSEVQIPRWGTELSEAAANDDWQAVIRHATLTSWKGIAAQVHEAIAE